MDFSKIVLFDGVCNLCNATVQRIIEQDHQNVFKFASLQSKFGQEFLQKNGLNQNDFDSIILVDGNSYFTHSDAVLKIGKHLKKYQIPAKFITIIPKFIRDFGYKIIAKNRYRLFGKQSTCWLPNDELKAKFLD